MNTFEKPRSDLQRYNHILLDTTYKTAVQKQLTQLRSDSGKNVLLARHIEKNYLQKVPPQLDNLKSMLDSCLAQAIEERKDEIKQVFNGNDDGFADIEELLTESDPQSRNIIFNFEFHSPEGVSSNMNTLSNMMTQTNQRTDTLLNRTQMSTFGSNIPNLLQLGNKENSYTSKYLSKKKKVTNSNIDMPLRREPPPFTEGSNFRRFNVKNM